MDYIIRNDHPHYSNLIEFSGDPSSIWEKISRLDEAERQKILQKIVDKKYPEIGWKGLKFDWELHQRPKQRYPEELKFKTLMYSLGRGFGKGTTLETPIPTPDGFTTMGDIKVGDIVFDERGNECTVTAVTGIYIPNKAYRLSFSDNTFIDVCDEHQWVTWTHQDRKSYNRNIKTSKFPENWVSWKNKDGKIGPSVKTSSEIVETFYQGSRNDLNHCVPVCGTLKTKCISIPIDAYAYGLFLGDGNAKDGWITCSYLDYTEYKKIFTDKNMEVSEFKLDKRTNSTGRFKINDLSRALRCLDCLNNKSNILYKFTRCCEKHRVEVINGLLDTDGSTSKTGAVEFSNTNKNIADFYIELARTLGQKPVVVTKQGKLNGIEKSLVYRVTFTPTRPDLFKLSRKANRIKNGDNFSQQIRNQHRMISKFEEISPKPMKCIQVDSENSMYLVGNQFLPTHNTRVGAETVRYLVETGKARRVIMIGATIGDVHRVMLRGDSGLLSISPPWFYPHWSPSYSRLEYPNGAVVEYYPLDIETEIPTEKGFKLLKDIEVGDRVFDEKGKLCTVTTVFPIEKSQKCYELVFNNQARVVADENHIWQVITNNDRNNKRYHKGKKDFFTKRTTQEIKDNLKKPHTGREDDFDNRVSLIKEIQYESKNFKIHPYVLGVWLGDGTSTSGVVCSADQQIFDEIRKCGYQVNYYEETMYATIIGLKPKLRELEVLGNKNIPEEYFVGSAEQRKDLLRGLLDTDGTIRENIGEICFSNTNKNLIDGVRRLVASLGGWSTVFLQKPKKNNPYNTEAPIWRVHIRNVENVFKLQRKLQREKKRNVGKELKIIECNEVEPRFVRCVTVDSESHLFAVTRDYIITHNSAENPKTLRGPQSDFIWADEIVAWPEVGEDQDKALDMALMGLRLGPDPRMLITTTPKPTPMMMGIFQDPSTYTITGSTSENKSNLSESFLKHLIDKYEGTALGRRELEAELILEIKGAMWKHSLIERYRIAPKDIDQLPAFTTVVVAIDPAMSAKTSSAETGMAVVALGEDRHFYVLAAEGNEYSPVEWAEAALEFYDNYGASCIVAETNQGGELVTQNIKSKRPMANVESVWAKQGKFSRAEPVVSLYEQGRVHHVGYFSKAEAQMTGFNPITNPKAKKDIVDALVYAITHLSNKLDVGYNYLPSVGGRRQKLTAYRMF